MNEKTVEIVLRAVVALALLALAGYMVVTGLPVPEWLVTMIVAVLGALFGFSAANGYAHSRKRGG